MKDTIPKTVEGKIQEYIQIQAHLCEAICLGERDGMGYMDRNNFHEDQKDKKQRS